ncbi:hypothetical protein QOZ88_05875 [Blastococcus sp. BMG 814]|uniref:Uncharacterized protein n=1 Tax=Blastococcus carthaginiensis TaxID=3050034 RepID=A0ABT9I9A3_9ACTN|nr:hypothetical protein [Blastococcus carthaginiensis]MDP5182158.1 hypothetical protein [Blastococcus carthaginiensis]
MRRRLLDRVTGPRRLAVPPPAPPRLRVWRSPHRFWWWRLTGPEGELLDDGAVPTWDEAMAVGLAALEVASLTPRIQEH